MITREEIALTILPSIYEESLNHEMDAHDIVSDAFRIADAFIEIRDAGRDDDDANEHSRPIGFSIQPCIAEAVK